MNLEPNTVYGLMGYRCPHCGNWIYIGYCPNQHRHWDYSDTLTTADYRYVFTPISSGSLDWNRYSPEVTPTFQV